MYVLETLHGENIIITYHNNNICDVKKFLKSKKYIDI